MKNDSSANFILNLPLIHWIWLKVKSLKKLI